jgi:hypothetical protein
MDHVAEVMRRMAFWLCLGSAYYLVLTIVAVATSDTWIPLLFVSAAAFGLASALYGLSQMALLAHYRRQWRKQIRRFDGVYVLSEDPAPVP